MSIGRSCFTLFQNLLTCRANLITCIAFFCTCCFFHCFLINNSFCMSSRLCLFSVCYLFITKTTISISCIASLFTVCKSFILYNILWFRMNTFIVFYDTCFSTWHSTVIPFFCTWTSCAIVNFRYYFTFTVRFTFIPISVVYFTSICPQPFLKVLCISCKSNIRWCSCCSCTWNLCNYLIFFCWWNTGKIAAAFLSFCIYLLVCSHTT